ncbi:hypothetical protein [Sinomonas atrocyanea]|uniref:hypothetical protein n=1 Tax=Sinomonas atrocyanea TaxID=37927 RepID=UPI002787D65B|nr:hypothetical protein [Sinomonas atrocyanea]MDQ0261914.1 hypothetical protein [Sinomonas atrocyanea]MDR6623678.1 hypothetical protein [Sinomonas atrocyanea]
MACSGARGPTARGYPPLPPQHQQPPANNRNQRGSAPSVVTYPWCRTHGGHGAGTGHATGIAHRARDGIRGDGPFRQALILAFHLDLASAAIALARRVRQAVIAEAAEPELSSVAGAADLAERARRNPGNAGAADLHAAAARLERHAHHSAALDSEPELLAA